MDEALQHLQNAINEIGACMEALDDPAMIDTLSTCFSNMTRVQKEIAQPKATNGASPGAPEQRPVESLDYSGQLG